MGAHLSNICQCRWYSRTKDLDISDHADGNAFFTCFSKFKEVLSLLEIKVDRRFKWF